MKDILLGGGLALGGATLLGASIYKTHKAKKAASEAFLIAANDRSNKLTRGALNKLRRYADVDVNIGRMSKVLQDSGYKDNAFYIPVTSYDNVADNLLATKKTGDLGTIVIGDDARALPVVAHELGHARNNKTGRLKNRILWQVAGGAIGALSAGLGFALRQTINKYNSNYPLMGLGIGGGTTLGVALGRLLANNAIVSEERDASNNAIEYLKKMRRTKKQLAQDTEVLDKALDTYKTARIWDPLCTVGLGALGGGAMYLANKLS